MAGYNAHLLLHPWYYISTLLYDQRCFAKNRSGGALPSRKKCFLMFFRETLSPDGIEMVIIRKRKRIWLV